MVGDSVVINDINTLIFSIGHIYYQSGYLTMKSLNSMTTVKKSKILSRIQEYIHKHSNYGDGNVRNVQNINMHVSLTNFKMPFLKILCFSYSWSHKWCGNRE